MMNDGQLIQDILIAIGLIGGVIVYAKGRIPQQTIKNLQASNESYVELDKARQASLKDLEKKLQDAIKTHADEKIQWTTGIADLQGQIKVYKELPLQKLADGIDNLILLTQDNAKSNYKILKVLTTKAKIDAQDRDVLTNQSKHIRDEVAKLMEKK
jgi:hypothetical protein